MTLPPRDVAAIAADLRALDRENDRLEHRVALASQRLKAAEAHAVDPGGRAPHAAAHLDRAAVILDGAG